MPSPQDLPERLSTALHVIYLVFNEGYSAIAGTEVTRLELPREAIRLGLLLYELLPKPEVMGLLARMLLPESRSTSRTSSDGDLILLEQQDRALWDKEQIAEGIIFVERALASHHFGPYTLQATISPVHAEADSVATADWRQIVMLYERLLRTQRSPVIELNRAVVVAMRDGPELGLSLIDELLARGELHLAHAARADLCRGLSRTTEARPHISERWPGTAGTGTQIPPGTTSQAGKETLKQLSIFCFCSDYRVSKPIGCGSGSNRIRGGGLS